MLGCQQWLNCVFSCMVSSFLFSSLFLTGGGVERDTKVFITSLLSHVHSPSLIEEAGWRCSLVCVTPPAQPQQGAITVIATRL